MQLFLFYIIAMTAFGAITTVFQVGKVRPVLTPGMAAGAVIWSAANIIGFAWILSSLQ